MTDDCASARKLFEAGKWADAEPAIRAVLRGATGDSEGNKALAEIWMGATLIELAPIADAVPHPGADTPTPADGKPSSNLDTDGDGVSNMLDACPSEPGPVENHGCPR